MVHWISYVFYGCESATEPLGGSVSVAARRFTGVTERISPLLRFTRDNTAVSGLLSKIRLDLGVAADSDGDTIIAAVSAEVALRMTSIPLLTESTVYGPAGKLLPRPRRRKVPPPRNFLRAPW